MARRNAPSLVFVLSEASPVLAQRWIDAGKLPFLGRMARAKRNHHCRALLEANRQSNQVFGPRWRANMKWPTSGSHRRKGIFFAQGPGIDANYRVNDAQILDLFPTWLRMLEIPVPGDLPGGVLEFCCRDAVQIMEGSAP